MNEYIPLADIIIQIANELGITSLRKEFWALKDEITEAVRDNVIEGKVGREVYVDDGSIRKFIENKKDKENIISTGNITLKQLKELIESMDKLTAEEQLIIIKNRLKNI